nr:hypothetical protein [uncultured Rhodopila sp.]
MAKQPHLGESLLAPGLIRLFGREFEGLILGEEGVGPASNNPLELQEQIRKLDEQIKALDQRVSSPELKSNDAAAASGAAAKSAANAAPDDKPRLARIYGFSYLGNYYKMANPPVLRVYGEGELVNPGYDPENDMNILGVEFKSYDFVAGIRMWPADHLDVAVRIDITIGWLREVLLDTDMSQETNVTSNAPVSRADVVGRDSGLVGRDSGLVGRDSGLVGRDSGFAGRPRR